MASPKNYQKVKESKYKSEWEHKNGGRAYIVKKSESGKWVAGVTEPSWTPGGRTNLLDFTNRDKARSYIVDWMRDNPKP